MAKNGCLLLSVPVRGDGTIDEEERKIVEAIATWTGRYGEAIFATRPWRLSGEGPTQVASGSFGEGKLKPFEAAGYPLHHQGPGAVRHDPGQAQRARSSSNPWPAVGAVQRVEIVGAAGALAFRQQADGLHVTIPDGASHDFGVALKISGERLT